MIALLRTLAVFQALLAMAVYGDEDGRVAGAYVFGHEVRSFQPCGSTNIYWTRPVNREIAARLRKRHGELAARPYGRIYVLVSGRPTDKQTTDFAESYAGYFQISELLQADRRFPPDCAIR